MSKEFYIDQYNKMNESYSAMVTYCGLIKLREERINNLSFFGRFIFVFTGKIK